MALTDDVHLLIDDVHLFVGFRSPRHLGECVELRAVQPKTGRQDSTGPRALFGFYLTLRMSHVASCRGLEFNTDEPASSDLVSFAQDLRIADVEGKARDYFH